MTMRTATTIQIMPVQVTILIKTIAIIRMTLQQKLSISENKVSVMEKDVAKVRSDVFCCKNLSSNDIQAHTNISSIIYDRFRKVVPITASVVVA